MGYAGGNNADKWPGWEDVLNTPERYWPNALRGIRVEASIMIRLWIIVSPFALQGNAKYILMESFSQSGSKRLSQFVFLMVWSWRGQLDFPGQYSDKLVLDLWK